MPNYNELREPRVGIMLHYDASASDAGSLSWLRNPASGVSYNWLVTDDGEVHEFAPRDKRAWHAGKCRPSHGTPHYVDANSAFYGISVSATAGERATTEQKASIVLLCYQLFAYHGWSVCSANSRIVGHNTEAWPRGRKVDPEGPDPSNPVLSVAEIRNALLHYYPPNDWRK